VITQTNPHVSLVPNLVYIRSKCRRCSGKTNQCGLNVFLDIQSGFVIFFLLCAPACLCPPFWSRWN